MSKIHVPKVPETLTKVTGSKLNCCYEEPYLDQGYNMFIPLAVIINTGDSWLEIFKRLHDRSNPIKHQEAGGYLLIEFPVDSELVTLESFVKELESLVT